MVSFYKVKRDMYVSWQEMLQTVSKEVKLIRQRFMPNALARIPSQSGNDDTFTVRQETDEHTVFLINTLWCYLNWSTNRNQKTSIKVIYAQLEEYCKTRVWADALIWMIKEQ